MSLNYLKFGIVVSLSDNFDGDRIKVHIRGIDPVNYQIDDLPYAFPLLPKLFYIKPKIGETVFVFVQEPSDFNGGDRFFLGPIISQPHKYEIDTIGARAFLKSGSLTPEPAPSMNPENRGVQLKNEDVGIIGRGSTDIVAKPNEIRLRAGKSLDLRKLNKENPSYIQVKHNTATNKGSVNIVSNEINLLSHNGVDKFNLVDPEFLINDEEYKKIIEKAHVLPFGDVLIEFIGLFIKAFSSHVHAYNGLPPDLKQIELKNLLSFELDKINSKNIRIN